MKKLIVLGLLLSLAACATCKSSDSPEVCRTKERDKSQPRLAFAINDVLRSGIGALALRLR